MTEEKAEQVFKSIAKMKVLSRLMDFEYNMHLPDISKSQLVRNHIAKIRQSLLQIDLNLNHIVRTKDGEILDEYCGELLDLLDLVNHLDLQGIKELNSDIRNYINGENE